MIAWANCAWPSMKDSPVWSPNRCARWLWNRSGLILRFKYFSEAGEDDYQSFLGVPLVDRGVLQGVLVVQTVEPRIFPENEIRLLTEAATRVAPVVSEARTLDRFIAPVQERLWARARNLWWSWDHDSSGLFRDLDPQRSSALNHSPISLLNEYPLEKLEHRATELNLHGRINYAYRRLREYHDAERTWAPATPVSCGRVRWLISPPNLACIISAHLFRWTWSSARRSHQERLRSRRPPRGRRPVLWPGIFPPAPGPRWLAARRIPRDRRQRTLHGDGHWQERQAGRRPGRYPPWPDLRKSVARQSGTLSVVSPRLRRGRQHS